MDRTTHGKHQSATTTQAYTIGQPTKTVSLPSTGAAKLCWQWGPAEFEFPRSEDVGDICSCKYKNVTFGYVPVTACPSPAEVRAPALLNTVVCAIGYRLLAAVSTYSECFSCRNGHSNNSNLFVTIKLTKSIRLYGKSCNVLGLCYEADRRLGGF